MTPRVGVKTTLTNGNAPLGALVPKQGPHFFPNPFLVGQPFLALRPNSKSVEVPSLIHSSRDRNIQLMQYVGHFCIAQARRVVLEGQMILVVNPKTPQPIGVGKCSERA